MVTCLPQALSPCCSAFLGKCTVKLFNLKRLGVTSPELSGVITVVDVDLQLRGEAFEDLAILNSAKIILAVHRKRGLYVCVHARGFNI